MICLDVFLDPYAPFSNFLHNHYNLSRNLQEIGISESKMGSKVYGDNGFRFLSNNLNIESLISSNGLC